MDEFYTLNDGRKIPVIGFGTYLAGEDECYLAVKEAIKTGYRHIDTASFYKNEKAVGAAVKDSGIPRSQLFITTKLWNDDQGYGNALKAFDKSLKKLGMDYVDLYLIHWPIPKGHGKDYKELNVETWKAFIKLRQEKLSLSIGVSNFMPAHIDNLYEKTGVMPAADQVEMHPLLKQNEVLDYCRKNGIIAEAWRPILKGNAEKYPVLKEIAGKYGKTPSQVAIKWALTRGVCPLPKSVHSDRIKKNFDVYDFTLSPEDIDRINAMPEERFGSNPSVECKF